LVEFTFKTKNFPRFSQLFCLKKEIHPKNIEKNHVNFLCHHYSIVNFCVMTKVGLVIGELWQPNIISITTRFRVAKQCEFQLQYTLPWAIQFGLCPMLTQH
jgi:hypothetical protein